jgi:uncharacterized repeat protein (TIGR03803 family)
MRKVGWCKTACAICVLCAVTAIASPAQTFTTLHSFDNTDGGNPYAGLIQATDGNLYGTTTSGGTNSGGTVFEVTPGGTLMTLYNFCALERCLDGEAPYAALLQDNDGNFYGTTNEGGTGGEPAGTVFKITTDGTLTTLYNFCSQPGCTDGESPWAPLVQGVDGSLFGTTFTGGVAAGYGTAFGITTGGKLTTLSALDSTDGANPKSSLVQTADGFYGTTVTGGANGLGSGTVFRITPSGSLTTLYDFCSQTGCADGDEPEAGLVEARNGDFYGTTAGGGSSSACLGGCGTIFQITPGGTLTTLHSFDGTDGSSPYAALIQASDGNLYGTTTSGGTNNNGTVFKVTLGGALKTLYNFCSQSGCADGGMPSASLIQDTSGKFYGTTQLGGSSSCAGGCGTVFSLAVGLGPFVETLPGSGKVGARVGILGTNLTGATSVTFNGTPAIFQVVSGSLITTTVPPGATTGKVQVVTPGGTLTSNVPFRVLP